MKKEKNNLDERQELKLLKIEHNGCWFAFWGLLAAMLIQMFLGNGSPKNLAGEWIVFMCLAIYLSAACMKNGIWDRKLKPNFKTNAIASVIAGTALGVIWFVISYQNYHNFIGSIMTGASGIRIRSTVYYVSVPKVILIDLMRCCVYNNTNLNVTRYLSPGHSQTGIDFIMTGKGGSSEYD